VKNINFLKTYFFPAEIRKNGGPELESQDWAKSGITIPIPALATVPAECSK
jgi:hypothetical protein